ncbi:MAG: HAD hydrolase family protein [Patescibacteria group bacterium]
MTVTPLVTDLDSTMIYLQSMNTRIDPHLLVNTDWVERRKMHIQCMKRSQEIIKTLADQDRIVAITTRSESQFKRTSLSTLFKVAIYDNGYSIEINGQKDNDWSNILANIISKNPRTTKQCQQDFISRVGPEFIHKVDEFEVFSIVYLVPERVDWVKANFDSFAYEGMKTSLQEVKFYIIPDAITKGHALTHLANKMGWNSVITAGDSLPDLEMMCLPISKIALISDRGELKDKASFDFNYKMFCRPEGFGALNGLDILEEYCLLEKLKF